MKPIIVATDYSECAEAAIRYAALIARYTKTDLHLFNVHSFDIHALNGLINAAEMKRSSENNQLRLENYAENLSDKFNIPMTARTFTMFTEETLGELVSNLNAGMIVMGMNKNFDENRLSGSVSNTIISNTRVPVLVVPEGLKLKLPERILFACDYQTIPDEGHFEALKAMANSFGAELRIFHVSEQNTVLKDKVAITEKIEAYIGDIHHSFKEKHQSDTLTALEAEVNEFEADIVIMSPHKYGFWSSLFHRSKTREMALRSTVPLLSVPS